MKHIPKKVKDHSVSSEYFELVYDQDLHLLKTSPDISESEIGRYYESDDYISHTDHKRSPFEFVYGLVKRYTLSRKQKLIKNYTQSNGALLDIGAGTGDFLKFCKSKGWSVSGVEPNEQARTLASEKGITLHTELDHLAKSYDVITMWHVLEHVYDVDQYLTWIKSHLKDSGFAFVAVPNFESHDAQHYGEFWAAYDVPRHRSHFSKKSIQLLANRNGLQLVETLPMKFDAYYVSLLSEKYKTGSMRIFHAMYRGWRSNRLGKGKMNYSSHIYVLKHQNTAN